MGMQTVITVAGVKQTQDTLENLASRVTDRTPLHQRWAILAHNWIMRNFQTEGGLVGGWKPLSPNTLAGRRSGTGRILQDTNRLRGSFMPTWDADQAIVGSDVFYSAYHEKGTAPYTIRPKKPGGRLRFVMATSTGVSKKSGMTKAEGGFVYAREVHHPGLVQRRMLPTADDPVLLPQLIKAATNYLGSGEQP